MFADIMDAGIFKGRAFSIDTSHLAFPLAVHNFQSPQKTQYSQMQQDATSDCRWGNWHSKPICHRNSTEEWLS